MKKTGKLFVALRYLCTFFVFAFGIITIIGSANSPQPTERPKTLHETRMEVIEMLGRQQQEWFEKEGLWENEKETYLSNLNDWNRDFQITKQQEKKFIQNMSDDQLNIYSSYVEASNNGNIAKQEICLRKLEKLFKSEQKNELALLSEQFEKLEERQASFIEKEKSLEKEGEFLDRERNEWWKKMEVVASMSNISISPQSYSNPLSDSLNSFQQTLQRQQQMRTMNSIDSSLKDISRSLRGW